MLAVDPPILRWPDALHPRDFTDPHLVNATMNSGTPIVGAPQSTLSDAGLWRFQMSGIPIFSEVGGRDLFAVWRTLYAGVLQQGTPILVPFRDWKRGPGARGALANMSGDVPHSDDTTFSDGSTYTSDSRGAKVATSNVAYATMMTVDVDPSIAASAAVPSPGDYFSIGERAYLIVMAWPDSSVANRFLWKIMPPLRTDILAGDLIEIVDPVCRMVLSGEDRQGVSLLKDLGAVARASLTFYEDQF